MSCLNLYTNISLEKVDTSSILSEATKTVTSIIGKPEAYVMIVFKGSVPMSLVDLKNLQLMVNWYWGPNTKYKQEFEWRNCIHSREQASYSKGNFFIKFFDSKGSDFGWNGGTF